MAADVTGTRAMFDLPDGMTYLDEGYAIMQTLIAEGVIGDFRAPDILRFGITPLYVDETDIARAVEVLAAIMAERRWDQPRFKVCALVT